MRQELHLQLPAVAGLSHAALPLALALPGPLQLPAAAQPSQASALLLLQVVLHRHLRFLAPMALMAQALCCRRAVMTVQHRIRCFRLKHWLNQPAALRLRPCER